MHTLGQGCTNPGRQVAQANVFYTVAPTIGDPQYGSCLTQAFGAWNFEMASICFENPCSLVLGLYLM